MLLTLPSTGPDEANAKVEHIHDLWVRNTPNVTERIVVKNARTITFLTKYPNRRIQIILKLMQSPTDILLNFDLDACALGFDGSQVLMLPRFVRALESGSSMFTMDLIWGHRFRNREATQNTRLFKYAERGFGVRLSPSYARSLEIRLPLSAEAGPDQTGFKEHAAKGEEAVAGHTLDQRDRFPQGKECGLKTLKRIAFLGRDFAQRFVYGVSPILLQPSGGQGRNSSEHAPESDQAILGRWNERVEKAAQNRRQRVHTRRLPHIDSDDIDGKRIEVCTLGHWAFIRLCTVRKTTCIFTQTLQYETMLTAFGL